MKCEIFQYLILLLMLCPAACCQQISDTLDTELLKQMREVIRTLENEVAVLKADVDLLKLRVQEDNVDSGNIDKVKSSGFWLSKSGKRHKASCRYFGSQGGRLCKPDEGVACKKCGG